MELHISGICSPPGKLLFAGMPCRVTWATYSTGFTDWAAAEAAEERNTRELLFSRKAALCQHALSRDIGDILNRFTDWAAAGAAEERHTRELLLVGKCSF
ncbi:MAG: hypothetical protein AAGU11_05875 [Syntrophobacteraceae bacterium]